MRTVAGLRQKITPEILLLAISSALGLAGIDVIYVARNRISRIYLLDAVAQLSLVLLWVFARTQQSGFERDLG